MKPTMFQETISHVCEVIIEEYAEDVIACLITPQEWQQIVDQFGVR